MNYTENDLFPHDLLFTPLYHTYIVQNVLHNFYEKGSYET